MGVYMQIETNEDNVINETLSLYGLTAKRDALKELKEDEWQVSIQW